METTTLSSKGQIIIPKTVRTSHRWRPGTRFVIEEMADGIILRTQSPFPATTLEAGLGCTGYTGDVKSIKEMDEALVAELRSQWIKGDER